MSFNEILDSIFFFLAFWNTRLFLCQWSLADEKIRQTWLFATFPQCSVEIEFCLIWLFFPQLDTSSLYLFWVIFKEVSYFEFISKSQLKIDLEFWQSSTIKLKIYLENNPIRLSLYSWLTVCFYLCDVIEKLSTNRFDGFYFLETPLDVAGRVASSINQSVNDFFNLISSFDEQRYYFWPLFSKSGNFILLVALFSYTLF